MPSISSIRVNQLQLLALCYAAFVRNPSEGNTQDLLKVMAEYSDLCKYYPQSKE